MADYRLYLLGDDGHIANAIQLNCADEPAALESAKQLVGEHPGELWQLDRLIAAFEVRAAPQNV
jgi:hypothetical protein